MARKVVERAVAMPLAGLVLAACVSQSAYDEQAAQLEQALAKIAAQQAAIAKMQAGNKWVMAGDLLFPEGGYELREGEWFFAAPLAGDLVRARPGRPRDFADGSA